MIRTIRRHAARAAGGLAISALGLLAVVLAQPAHATATTFPYNVTAYWQMSSVPSGMPDNTPEPGGPFTWPQSRIGGIPDATCTPVAIQVDDYTIDNQTDADYLANLHTLSSPSDDARLHPHNYYAEVIVNRSTCDTTTPPPPPTSSSPAPTPSTSTPAPSTSASTSTPPPTHTHSTTVPPTTSSTTHHPHSQTSSIGPPVSKSRTVHPHHVIPHRLASTGFDSGRTAVLGSVLLAVGIGFTFAGYRGWGRRQH